MSCISIASTIVLKSSSNTSVCLFEDATKMSTVFSDVSEECLNEFVAWADRWQLQVAEHKCCVLTIGNITSTIYHLKGLQLLNVNEYRDLGVIVHDKCLFKQHISSICRKAYSIINVIFAVFILLTSVLSLRHINHLSAQCWNTVRRYGTRTYQLGITWA